MILLETLRNQRSTGSPGENEGVVRTPEVLRARFTRE